MYNARVPIFLHVRRNGCKIVCPCASSCCCMNDKDEEEQEQGHENGHEHGLDMAMGTGKHGHNIDSIIINTTKNMFIHN